MGKSKYVFSMLTCLVIFTSGCGNDRIKNVDIEGESDIEARVSLQKEFLNRLYIGGGYGQISGEGNKPTILQNYVDEDPDRILLQDSDELYSEGSALILTGPGTVDQEYTYKYFDLFSSIHFLDMDKLDLFASYKIRRMNSVLTLSLRETDESITQDRYTIMHGLTISPQVKLLPGLFGYLEAEVLISNDPYSQKHSIGLKFAPQRNLNLFIEATNFIYSDDREPSKVYFESNHIGTGLKFEF